MLAVAGRTPKGHDLGVVPSESASWVKRELTALVSREYEFVRRFYHRLWLKPLGERVKRGRAVDQLRLLSADTKRGVVRFECVRNESRFRAGDVLRLSRNQPLTNFYEVTWYGEELAWVGVTFYQKATLKKFLEREPKQGTWTIDESYIDLESLYLRAFESLTDSAMGRDQVAPIIAGALTPTVDLDSFDQEITALAEREMNDSQQEAAAMALAAQPYALIQGPPGTGKTRTLGMIVDRLLERRERVLITALTHRAIHEALQSTSKLVSMDQLAKIGVPVYDPSLTVKDYGSFAESPLADSGGAYAIGATPFTLWSRRLRDVEFDTVIMDESSQVTPALAVMAMLKARRYVFVGDHEQLPPVMAHLQDTEPADTAVQSIFGRLRDHSSSTMLRIGYRMNAELCAWPSEQFYSGELKAAPENAGRRLVLPNTTPNASFLASEPCSEMLLLDHGECRTASSSEASAVVTLIEVLLKSGLAASAIGIVVPYRRQANRVRQRLRTRRCAITPEQARAITVDTVERFQGSEREVMILSFTASDPDFIRQQARFLFQPQRLNVALTRARSKLYLLVSETLQDAARKLAAAHDEDAALFVSLLDATPKLSWTPE